MIERKSEGAHCVAAQCRVLEVELEVTCQGFMEECFFHHEKCEFPEGLGSEAEKVSI